MAIPPGTKKPKKTDEDVGDKFRITNVEVRCARAIGPYLFVRAAVTVTVLKGADKKEAIEFATDQCKETMDLMQAKELSPKKRIEFTEDDEIPMEHPVQGKNPF